MSSVPHTFATLEDLYQVDGKAELIGGRIVPLMPTGRRPNLIAGRIYRSLAEHVDNVGHGEVYTDNMGFVVAELSSGRQSFSPDVSFYNGPFPRNPMRFIDGPPMFAVEVRSEGDYGAAAEVEIAMKRADYFEAGTEIVWDVDPLGESIRVYRASTPDDPVLLSRGQNADAEPVVTGWQISIDRVFD